MGAGIAIENGIEAEMWPGTYDLLMLVLKMKIMYHGLK